MSRLRVLVLIDSLGWGGAELLLSELAAAAPSAGLDLHVAYLNELPAAPAAERLLAHGIHAVRVPIEGLVRPASWLAVRRHLAEVNPQVVHTHLGYSDFLGGLAARSLRLPAVSTVHVMGWDPGRRNRLKVELMSLVRRRCMSRVVAVSSSARQWLLEQRWARPDQALTLHNGVRAQRRPGAGAAVRAEMGIPSSALVVAMISVLRPGKGHDVAIAAVLQLRQRFPDVHLLIVGDGPLRREVEELAGQLGPGATVAGHRDDVMEVLDAADVLLHPSSVDAFPTALLEAMAAGVPIVASAVGGIPEILEEGAQGFLVEGPPQPERVARALEPLLGDRDLRLEMGAAGRRRHAAEFTAERWAQRTRAMYDEILAADGGSFGTLAAPRHGITRQRRSQ